MRSRPVAEKRQDGFFLVFLRSLIDNSIKGEIMALISFRDWLVRESSPMTRLRDGYARGNYPASASMTSHSTPSPYVVEKLEKDLRKKRRKKRRKNK